MVKCFKKVRPCKFNKEKETTFFFFLVKNSFQFIMFLVSYLQLSIHNNNKKRQQKKNSNINNTKIVENIIMKK